MFDRRSLLGAALGAICTCLVMVAAQKWREPSPMGSREGASPAVERQLVDLEHKLNALDSSLQMGFARQGTEREGALRAPALTPPPSPAAPAASGSAAAMAAAPDDAALLPPGDEQAAERGRDLINAAFDARRWSHESREEFRRLRVTMPPAEGHELTRRLFIAINSGAIIADLKGPPI